MSAEVDEYIRNLVNCARALPQKEWRWGQFARPDGSQIQTVEHVCEVLNHIANKSKKAELWGVDLGVDGPVVCCTGNGPLSEDHARYIAAARPEVLLWILDELAARSARLMREALEALTKTPLIEAITPTSEEWRTCETVQDTYDLMKHRIRAAADKIRAALTQEKQT